MLHNEIMWGENGEKNWNCEYIWNEKATDDSIESKQILIFMILQHFEKSNILSFERIKNINEIDTAILNYTYEISL